MEKFSDFNIEIPAGASGQVRVLCPRCSVDRKKNREKCLSVDASKGVWLCHHCGYTGALGSEGRYISEHKSKTVTIPKYTATANLPENVIKYFEKRGISERVLKAEKVGYGSSWKDKNGIQFPYFKGGIAVNVKHRSHEKEFRQEKNAEKCLYRFDQITNCKGDILIMTEGEIDCLSFLEAGSKSFFSLFSR